MRSGPPAARWTVFLVLLGGVASLSCATDVAVHPLERTEFWHRYRELSDVRAAAISGDPEDVWVGGAASGLATASEAEHQAIAECEKQRSLRRLQSACVVYAVGDEVVSSRPDPE
jgi:hypothetical protein